VFPATCVRACFAALARLVEHGGDYERDFRTAVQVRTSLHCGPWTGVVLRPTPAI
jgi:hypothetical protein